LTTTKRFLLDNGDFSSIIYIWYEGVRLRPRLVSEAGGLPSGRAQPFRRQMAKKAKKAANEEGKKK
jgi:hypothetical protein